MYLLILANFWEMLFLTILCSLKRKLNNGYFKYNSNYYRILFENPINKQYTAKNHIQKQISAQMHIKQM